MTQQTQPTEPVRLHNNENPMGPSPLAMQSVRDTLSEANTYSGDALLPQLREAIAAAWDNRITADHIVLGSGSVGVMEMIGRLYLDSPEAECLVTPPVFPYFLNYCQANGRKLIKVPLQPESFKTDLTAVLAAITPNTRIVYLCNPNNPTGSYITARELADFMAQVPDHPLVIHDQAYHHFVDAPDFPDSLQPILDNKHFLVLHSFSKVFGLAGMRLGYAIARPDVIAHLSTIAHPFLINKLNLKAGVAALSDSDHMQRSIANNAAGKAWLTEQLEALDCRVWPTQASFMIFQYATMPAATIIERLEAAGVLVRPAFFSPDHVRVSIGNPAQNQQFIAALSRILAEG